MSDPRQAARDRLALFMEEKGKRNTRQRDLIVDIFLEAEGHLTLNELLRLVQGRDDRVGFATVYRTMKLLTEAGVAEELRFGEGQTRYELAHADEHHDHLICQTCGTIFEFEDDEVEAIQERIAKRFGLRVTDHRHEIYGVCTNADCEHRPN
jgi:Fur family ferric uptake transcriptional regulator